MEFEAIQLEDFHYMDDDLIDDMDEDEYGIVGGHMDAHEYDMGEGGSKRVLYVSIFEIVNNVIIPWASILNMIARLEFMKGAAMFWEMEVRSLHEHEILISSIASGFGNYRSIRKENAFCGLIVRKNFDQHRKIFDPWDILFANVTMEIDRIVRTIRSSFQLLNDGIKYLVLAEAETMFDHGFVPDIHKLEVLLKAYRDSSFWDCKQASEEAIAEVFNVFLKINFSGKLFSDSESIQARAEASVLLKQLHFPVDSLQVKLLEKLEQSLGDIQLKTNDIENVSMESNDPKQGKVSELVHITAHEDEWNQMIVSQAQGIAQHVVMLAKEAAALRPYIMPSGEVGLGLMWLIEEIKELGTRAEAYA
ncbi:hypothetical protein V6N12_066768 [Hibiscus sabdariffa]|uniref:Uncharacterized protein n=1 Tax=Hibiscus sabdariffa TaxID=183260 RepID=A0ABR2C933_9ROSI